VLELLLMLIFSKLCFSLFIPDSCTASAIYFTTVSCSTVHPSIYRLMLHNFSSVKLQLRSLLNSSLQPEWGGSHPVIVCDLAYFSLWDCQNCISIQSVCQCWQRIRVT